jgi:hypothetical protein
MNLLSVKQVSDRYGVSIRSLRYQIKKGGIPYTRIFGRYGIPDDEVLKSQMLLLFGAEEFSQILRRAQDANKKI